MLTDAQKQYYSEHGFLVLPNFIDAPSCAQLRERAAQIVDAFDPNDASAKFASKENERREDDYFLASANQVRCFFEEEAFDSTGALCRPKEQALNKIGHALHTLDPVFSDFSKNENLAQIALDLGIIEPQIRQSMYIFKPPLIGGAVRWHQDATYLATTPVSVTTFWFALEDATQDNACLWVAPGGHRGPLREIFEREGAVAAIRQIDATPWPEYSQAMPLEAKAGSLIVFHGLLPHSSKANRSTRSRHAYTLHVTDGRATYSDKNWIQAKANSPVSGFV